MLKIIVVIVLVIVLLLIAVIWLPSYLEVRISMKTRAIRNQQSQIKSLLDSCKEAFPENGKELREYLLSRSDANILVDPFTGKDFSFVTEKTDQGINWYLISAGPDKKIQSIPISSSFLIYDSTNGMISPGDIVSTGAHEIKGRR